MTDDRFARLAALLREVPHVTSARHLADLIDQSAEAEPVTLAEPTRSFSRPATVRHCGPGEFLSVTPEPVAEPDDDWYKMHVGVAAKPAVYWSPWIDWRGGECPVPELTVVTGRYLADLIDQSAEAEPKPAVYWSPWFDWRGGECPVPPETVIIPTFRDNTEGPPSAAGIRHWTHDIGQLNITRFRYAADNPELWLPRPAGWIAPKGTRLEWLTKDTEGNFWPAPEFWDDGNPITHIRLLPQPTAPGLPEGWTIDNEGNLFCNGLIVIRRATLYHGAPDAIRQAVAYWLAEMQRRAG
jgi:hypothetical protein